MTDLGLSEKRKEEAQFDIFSLDEVPVVETRRFAARLAADVEETDWDDTEGYYVTRPGEIVDGRYRVLGAVGRGVFSSVLRAQDLNSERYVALKVIRSNETMSKAALKEIQVLKALESQQKTHCVEFLGSCEYKSHQTLIFEAMAMNLRDVLKKYGKHVGVNVRSVKVYAGQLFLALRHLAKCKVVHADLKPDNILVSENNAVVKICDFGSAFFDDDPSDPAPYLVSRFYRAPEIILGIKYDRRVDQWSLACCLFELYSGKVLFPGVDNNNMLLHFMNLKGRIPTKLLKAHRRAYSELLLLDPHFVQVDNKLMFQHRVFDKNTNEARLNLIDLPQKPKFSLKDILLQNRAGADDHAAVNDLADLCDLCLMLNPEHRPSLNDCLKHPFIQGRDDSAKKTTNSGPAPASSSLVNHNDIATTTTTASFLPPPEKIRPAAAGPP